MIAGVVAGQMRQTAPAAALTALIASLSPAIWMKADDNAASSTVINSGSTGNGQAYSIAANDTPNIVVKSGATAGAYIVSVDAVAAGSCRVSIRNMTAGALSEALVLQFNIEKGAIA